MKQIVTPMTRRSRNAQLRYRAKNRDKNREKNCDRPLPHWHHFLFPPQMHLAIEQELFI
jgi:hypothetical protein